MNSSVRRNIFADSESGGITVVCYLLLIAALALIIVGGTAASTIWMWSWPLALILVALSAWKRLWALTVIGILILIFPLGVILFQGF